MAGRRWNGWGDPAVGHPLSPHGRDLLAQLVGPAMPVGDAGLAEVVATVPPSRVEAGAALSVDAEERIRHARGQSLPDWIALRSGRLGAVPDAVAHPTDATAVRDLLGRASARGWELIPFGGGTSVVGGVNVGRPSGRS